MVCLGEREIQFQSTNQIFYVSCNATSLGWAYETIQKVYTQDIQNVQTSTSGYELGILGLCECSPLTSSKFVSGQNLVQKKL